MKTYCKPKITKHALLKNATSFSMQGEIDKAEDLVKRSKEKRR